MKRPRSRIFQTTLALAAAISSLVATPASSHAAKKVKAVATTPIFGEILRQVGGERVHVKVLMPPTRDVHFYEPRPSDIVKLSKADLFVHGGLDLELWRWPLMEAARNRNVFPGEPGDVDCANGMQLLEIPKGTITRSEGCIHIYGNPHYWIDPANLGIIAANVAAKLARVDPSHAAEYERNRAAFQSKLDEALPRWKARLAPYAGGKVVAYHNAWPYFARAFNLRIETFLEPKPNIPPSGSHLKRVLDQVKEEKIPAILIEPHNHRPYAEQVASETGSKVVLISQMPGGMPGTEDLFDWMDMLTATVAEALGSESRGAG